ncbi:ABC transporter substrate-binding protein [Naasia sp. SYSU D00057]|uniref:ABC transporter substrate-binding protein n=1 Tax=Naasia sp. SYSU D00057 TaxID=2817380 RepID=UPI001B3046B9|nr:ABC transporter substrate-binding protein [Naasia sp. SYSU D00057]
MSVFSKATASRSRPLKSALGGIAVLGISALVLSGCAASESGNGDGGDSGAAAEDLTLNLGTILPQTGTLAVLGPPEFAGVDLALQDINDAGAGITVNVSHKDSGDTTTDLATQSVTALLSEGVSAIVGAASSGVSLSVIDQVTGAGVVQVSPANTSPAFSTYEDDGYYFRTAPSDVLQGQVVGQKIASDGATTVSILYANNDYGIGLNENVTATLEEQGVEVVAAVTFDEATTDFAGAVTDVLAPNPDAVLMISYDEIRSAAEQFASRGFDFSKLYGVDGNYGVITESDTNVDIAGAQFTNPGVQASDEFQQRLQDLVKEQGEDPLTVFSYGPESYDATTLLALAALAGGATDGQTIRDNLQDVSAGGEKCESFADCAELLADGEDIDYEGISGPVTFDENGDPSQAYVSIYQYQTGNKTEYVDSVFGDLTE